MNSRQLPDDPLPTGATIFSRQRLLLATELAAASAVFPGLEIALRGSTARGVADEASDIELNFWGTELPDAVSRKRWLLAQGAGDLELANEQTPDGTVWDRWRWRNIWFEAGWQFSSMLEAQLQAIHAASVLDASRLVLAEVVANAIVVRTDGRLSSWQDRLQVYPDLLAERLIADTLQRWRSPYTAVTRWATVRRAQPLALTQELAGDIRAMLRILFALNRQWEPDFKWLAQLSNRLILKPERLVERVNDVFYSPAAATRMSVCTDLLLDTLKLLPATELVATVRATLQKHPTAT